MVCLADEYETHTGSLLVIVGWLEEMVIGSHASLVGSTMPKKFDSAADDDDFKDGSERNITMN